MEETLIQVLEFVIEWGVVAAGISLVAACLSIAILYPSKGYRSKTASIIVPAILTILFAAAGVQDYGSLKQWACFTLPALLITTSFVYSSCYRKRLPEKL